MKRKAIFAFALALCLLLFGCQPKSSDPIWMPDLRQQPTHPWVQTFDYTAVDGQAADVRTCYKDATGKLVEDHWSRESGQMVQTPQNSTENGTICQVEDLPIYVRLLGSWYTEAFDSDDFRFTIGTAAREDFDELLAAYPAMICQVTDGTWRTMEEGFEKDQLYGLAAFHDQEGRIFQLVLLQGIID